MIISASRRSDIPAFYSRWFMNRIEAGFVLVANPFNSRQIRRIRLRPDAVEAIVFWTRHAAPLLPALPRLEALGYRSLFHVTLTGYPSRLEPHLPPLEQALASFLALSRLLGPERVIWRYDPILLCNWLPVAEHQRRFSQLAAALAGHTRQVVISFADLYGKSVRQLDRVPGLQYQDLLAQPEPLAELLGALQRSAADYDLQLSSCAEAVDLSRWQIAPGRCIDVALLNRLFGLDLPQRPTLPLPGGPRPVFPPRPVPRGGPQLAERQSTYDQDYYTDWIRAFLDLVERNARFRDGAEVDLAANQRLGELLARLAPAA